MGPEMPKSLSEGSRRNEVLDLSGELMDICAVKAPNSTFLASAIKMMSPDTRQTLETAMAQAKREEAGG